MLEEEEETNQVFCLNWWATHGMNVKCVLCWF
jgi:hypothetical protein